MKTSNTDTSTVVEQETDNPVLYRGDNQTGQSLETLFDALSDRMRSRALYELINTTGPLTVTELADRISSTMDTPSSTIETELRHHHLPKLEQEDLITFEETVNTVSQAASGPRLQFLIEYVAQEYGWNTSPSTFI